MRNRSHCIHCLALLRVLFCTALAVGDNPPCAQADAGSVFDKASPSIRLPGGPPAYISSELRRVSPDGNYVASLTGREAEIGVLRVYKKRPGAKRLLRRDRVSREFGEVNGCAWVPHHGHWLVISTGGSDYVPWGVLALWTGQGHIRILQRAKSPDGEGFNVRSVSPDGRVVLYEHFGVNSPDPEDKRNTALGLVLPR